MNMPATIPFDDNLVATDAGTNSRAKPLLLDSVSKRFGSVTALQPMTLDIHAGELLALLGPSGCGKTTTLRLIAGFDFPDTGAIRIDGVDISHLPPNRRGLGMVFQNYSLFPHLSIAENIGFGLKMAGVARQERDAAVARMLEMIRLPGYGDRRIGQLSGGQQQRVALARALVTNPSVLLLDEPLGALDKNLREGMQFELRRLQRQLGITSVMVTHDQEEALTMSDRVVVMNQGRILQIGTPREVYERPRNRFVAEFLGTANIFTADVVERHGSQIKVRLPDSPASECWIEGRPDVGTPGRRVELAIRPEKIALNQSRPGDIALRGITADCVFKGNQYSYVIDVPGLGTRISVSRQSASGEDSVPLHGAPVNLSFAPRDLTLLDAEAGAATAERGA